jgi:hypothetical protein
MCEPSCPVPRPQAFLALMLLCLAGASGCAIGPNRVTGNFITPLERIDAALSREATRRYPCPP